MKEVPRLMIAAVRSGAGKTSIATGIMGALAGKGLRVQGFKVGPDFIDPGYHTAATGRWARNLDTWLLAPQRVKELFRAAAADAEVAVVEGVMGLFDGVRGRGEEASSAEVAKLLGCPVVLVVDARARARSVLVEFLGCRALDPALSFAGVILNRVQGPRHLEMLQEAFEENSIPVLGAVQEGSLPRFTERHLGLVPTPEQRGVEGVLSRLADAVARQVDLEGILSAARAAGSLPGGMEQEEGTFAPEGNTTRGGAGRGAPVRVAYAWDEAFNFYYRDGLETLAGFGVELVPFSPLSDPALPPGVGGVIIGGGFPELFAKDLAANAGMLESLRLAHRKGLPIYAECGGFMYLCERLVDQEGRSHALAGLVPGVCRMERRLAGMGYVTARALAPSILCETGETLRGHVFHYSSFAPLAAAFPWAFSFIKEGREERPDGYVRGNLLASYLHLHFAASPQAAARFASACQAGARHGFV
ncbi:MAG: cobyrinate a,c-diamide synthase [Pelotomaculum sp.]|uniref:Cobyrinate a,c-diamide synthase n=1 Tax=Pelotomaculum thermopropionicum (strain DSM 13744 / JCM 10971 / SI) TaxID=370438 RepID=A5D3N5_PELTS|nr:cobyrinate a,c-diamide synthase [Pelotomaculum sp.]BAF59140.1 cobyrinic acid a,c-diamide synthase [Pelotomaculum thermopropionicum SI]